MTFDQENAAQALPDSQFTSRLKLDRESEIPLHKQLFLAVRKQINALELMPGQLLPSTRQLSDQLGVSRTTVVRAYDDLLGQGYISVLDGVGTFVSQRTASSRVVRYEGQPPSSVPLSLYAKRLLEMQQSVLSSADQPALNYGAAPLEELPVKQWRQILLKHCREHNPTRYDYAGEAMGFLPLREALAAYLQRSRAIACEAPEIAVFSASLDAVKLIARLLLDPGDSVIVENPGFSFARKYFASLDATVHAVPVDDHGISMEQLHKAPDNAKFIYVTPSHQDPTGATMSLERRHELLAWAERTGALIIEDDYDAEYRYTGSPLPALHSLSTSANVIYLASFWKTLHPLVASSYLVVPPALSPVVSHAINMRETSVTSLPMLEQYTLTEFVQSGHLERYIRKTFPIYRSRWQAAVAALTKYLRKEVSIARESAAMHVLIRFAPRWTDEEILKCATRAGFAMVSLTNYYQGTAPGGEFLVPFAHISEAHIEETVFDFSKLLLEKAPV